MSKDWDVDDGYEIECFWNCSHLNAPVVPRFNRPPIHRFTKSSLAIDKTEQVSSGSFVRRDGDFLGSVRPETTRSRDLRLKDQTLKLSPTGSEFSDQFRRQSWTRRKQEQAQYSSEQD